MDEINRQFEERYLLVLDSEDRLYESIVGITKEYMEGKIPANLYVKSLDIANGTIQKIHSMRTDLHRMIKQIRYRLFKMKEFIEINYEEGMDFVITLDQVYEEQYKAFLNRSHYFLKEWNHYEKEHGICIPEINQSTYMFELIYKMVNLISVEYHGQKVAGAELTHVYMLARELHGLLINARDLALNMKPRIVADCYYMDNYLGVRPYPRYGSFNPEFEFKRARENGYPDFEYVREPGFKPEFKPEFKAEFKLEFKPWGREQRRHHDLVPQSQIHQQMTGNIGQFQSSHSDTPKYFRSRIFEPGNWPGYIPPTRRSMLQTNEHVDWVSSKRESIEENIPEKNTPEEASADQPIMSRSIASGTITPPGPKLYRDDNTR